MDYYPFGKILREYLAGHAERYLTTGNERDSETDFDYRNARFNDAEIGRFLSVDPLASEMPEWSPYNFVFSNTIRFVDPRGLAPEWKEDGEGNLIADENDNLQTLAEYLNISSTEAYEIFGNLENWIDANGKKAVSGVGNIKGFRLKIPSVRNAQSGGNGIYSYNDYQSIKSSGVPMAIPYVYNLSTESIFIKPENRENAIRIPPNSIFIKRMDGVSTRQFGVYKTGDFMSVIVDKTGMVIPIKDFAYMINVLILNDFGFKSTDWYNTYRSTHNIPCPSCSSGWRPDSKWDSLFNVQY